MIAWLVAALLVVILSWRLAVARETISELTRQRDFHAEDARLQRTHLTLLKGGRHR